MIIPIASFCDRMFEFKPGVDVDFDLEAVKKTFALNDRVIGGTAQFCTFLYWQLKRYGYKPKIWKVSDLSKTFYVVEVSKYFLSYHDGMAFTKGDCPWRRVKYTANLKTWHTEESTILEYKLVYA